MQELKKWAEKYKQLCVMLGILGLLLSPFLWPFFLAILLNSLSLAVPVLVVLVIVDYTRKEKKGEDENDGGEQHKKDVHRDAEENVSKRYEKYKESVSEENLQKKVQKGAQPLRDARDDSVSMDEECYAAVSWYQMEGRERIQRLIKKLETERIYAFSITPEGICTVREDSGFRRIGVIRNFPRRRIRVIEKELNKDGIRTAISGKYLWVSWGKGRRR